MIDELFVSVEHPRGALNQKGGLKRLVSVQGLEP